MADYKRSKAHLRLSAAQADKVRRCGGSAWVRGLIDSAPDQIPDPSAAMAYNAMRKAAVQMLADRMIQLVRQYGSLRAAARAVQIDHSYMYRLAAGTKIRPGDGVLRKLGLLPSGPPEAKPNQEREACSPS